MKARRIFKLPDSFFGQLLLLLTLGFVIFHAVNFAVVCNVQWLYVEQAEKSRAEHLASYWTLFNSMPRAQREAVVARMKDAYESGAIKETLSLSDSAPDWGGGVDPEVSRQLSYIHRIFENAGAQSPAAKVRAIGEVDALIRVHLPSLEFAVELSDGTWLQITTPYDVDDRVLVWTQRAFLIMLALVTLVIVIVLVRRMTRPIDGLSRAVEEFGRHPEVCAPLPEEGVREIRSAAHSFNRMRGLIQGNIAERNRMIAARTHDLRTPLTKMQLRLERVEPADLREKLQDAVLTMRSIIEQGLQFARSLATQEEMTRIDLRSFVQSLADDYADVGKKVEFVDETPQSKDPLVVSARTLCLKRCLENLISNACTYAGEATLVLKISQGAALVCVCDRGPGIPQECLEHIFEPYYRVEGSRNRSFGGTGLGLAIARNMAILNAAELRVQNLAQGGLMAELKIPLC